MWTQSESGSGLSQNRDPYYYILSTHSLLSENFRYAIELAQRQNVESGLFNLSFQEKSDALIFKAKIEYRSYQSGFGKDFVGRVENQYVSYDQLNKTFTNPMSIFSQSDDGRIYALHLNIDYKLNHHWRIETLNEVGKFDFKNIEDDDYYFYRAGITHCPLENRDDCVTVFVSNKVLNDSYSRPPTDVARNNNPLFKPVDYFGVEGRFRF